jgi:fibronectin type 3 domain-containing protein
VCNELTWSGSAGVTYNVYRHKSSPVPLDAEHRIASGVTDTNYTDCGKYKRYYYVVTAVNAGGESGPSNTVQATEECPPAAPLAGGGEAGTLTESTGDPLVTKYYYFNLSTDRRQRL